MSNVKKKTELLGMPYGTAQNKLRKMILFKLVATIEIDWCYRCKEKIDSIEDFSIEHIEPWMLAEGPIRAFFDLDNIAFSHRSCNFGATNRDKTHCSRGHEYTDANTYVYNEGRNCRQCKRTKQRELRNNNKPS